MKTVLSNTKRFLAVFLALAMIVLAVPNAPVELLAAEVNPEVEAVETTEAEASAAEEDVAAPVEDAVAAEDAAVVEDAAAAEETAAPVEAEESTEAEEVASVDEAVAGDAEEEEIAVDSRALGMTTGNLSIIGSILKTEANHSAVLNGKTSDVDARVLYIEKEHEGLAIAAEKDATANGSPDERDKAKIDLGTDDATWSVDDEKVLTIDSENVKGYDNDPRQTKVKGKSVGEASVNVSYMDGITKDTRKAADGQELKVYVVDSVASENATTGTKDSDGVWNLDLITIEAEDETLTKQTAFAEEVGLEIMGGQDDDQVTWNTEKEVTANKYGTTVVVSENTTGKVNVYTATGNGGTAAITATLQPKKAATDTDVSNNIVFKNSIKVNNQTVGIHATREGFLEEVSTNVDEAFTVVTGNEWEDVETVEVGDSVIYNLSALDSNGKAAEGITWVTDYDAMEIHKGAGNANLSVEFDGNKMILTGQYSTAGTYDYFHILAKKTISTVEKGKTVEKQMVVGRVMACVIVEDSDTFAFVSTNGKDKNDNKYAFLSASASANGDGDNPAVLATTSSVTGKRTWTPATIKGVSFNAYVVDPYSTKDATQNGYAREYFYDDKATSVTYGKTTVNASITNSAGNVVSDNYELTVLGVGVEGETKALKVEDSVYGTNSYVLKLGMVASSNNTKATYGGWTVTDNDSLGVKTVSGQTVKVSANCLDWRDNTKYAETAKLTVFGAEKGTVTFSTVPTLETVSGQYVDDVVNGVFGFRVASVAADGTVTALAPGSEIVWATYTEGTGESKRTYGLPINIIVEERSDDVTVSTNGDRTILTSGSYEIGAWSYMGDNNQPIKTGVDYSYAVKSVRNAEGKDVTSTFGKGYASTTDGVFSILAAKQAEITEKLIFTVQVTATVADLGKTETESIDVTVVPNAKAGVKLSDATDKDQFVTRGEKVEDIVFTNENELELEVVGNETYPAYDEKVVSAEIDENTLKITAIGTGKTTVYVNAVGATSEPIAISVASFGVKGNGVTFDEETGKYVLTTQQVGSDVFTTSTLMLFCEDESTALSDVTWKKDSGNNVTIGAASGLVTPTGAGDATFSASYKTTVDGKTYNASNLGKITLKIQKTNVTVKVDAATKEISAKTAADSDNWTIVPTVTFTNDKGEIIEGVDYVVTGKVSKEGVVGITPSADKKSLVISPVANSGADSATVTVEVRYTDTEQTLLDSSKSVTVTVEVLDVHEDKEKAIDSAPLYVFTNYALSEDGTVIEKPQLQDVLDNYGDGYAFNDGWSWGDKETAYIEDLIDSTDTSNKITIPAVYKIKDTVVKKQNIDVNVGTIDGISISDGYYINSTETDGVYELKAPMGETIKAAVSPYVLKHDGSWAVDAELTSYAKVFQNNLTYSYDATGTAVRLAKKAATGFEITTIQLGEGKKGTGRITATAGGFSATVNVATADKIADMYFVSTNGTDVSPNFGPITDSEMQKNWLNNGNYFMDLYRGNASATIQVAIPEKDATSNMDLDSNNVGIVTIESSDPSVIEISGVNGTNMRANLKEGVKIKGAGSNKVYIYTATINPKSVGEATLTIEAQDGVKTTERIKVYVTDGRNPVAEEVVLSRTSGKTAEADLKLNFASNEFFQDGHEDDYDYTGYNATTLEIGSDPTGQISKSGSYSTGWKLRIADTSKVTAGTNTVIIRGDSALLYMGAGANDDYRDTTKTQTKDSFSNIPVKVTITDDAFVDATIPNVDLVQGGTAALKADITSESGWTVTGVEFKDPEAARAAGLTISGLTISAADNANIVENKTYDVIVTGTKGDLSGIDNEATLKVTVTKAETPVATVGAVSVKQGSSAAMTAEWSDKVARINSFALVGTASGLEVSEAGVITAKADAPLGAQTINVEVTGAVAGKDPIKSTVAVTVTVSEKDPIVVDVTMADITLRQGQSKSMTVKSITKGFSAIAFAFAGEAPNGVTFTDSTTMAASSEALIDTTGKDYVLNVTVTNGVDTTTVPVTVNIKVLEAGQGGDHDVEPTPDTEEGVEDITDDKFKAYQVESAFDLTNVNATTTVYFVGTLADPDAVDVISDYFVEKEEIVGSGYTKVVLELKTKTLAFAQSAAKSGKKVAFKLSKGDSVCKTNPTVNLKVSAALPKINLTVKNGTVYADADGKYAATFYTSDKNGIFTSADTEAIYVADKNSTTAVEGIEVTNLGYDTAISYDNAGEQKNGGLLVTNSSWVEGASVFVPFKITNAKASQKPAIKLGKTSATIGNKAGQSYTTTISLGGMTVGEADYTITPDSAVEGVEATIFDNGVVTFAVTGESVTAGKIKYTINTAETASVQAAKAATFTLNVTDKEVKASYQVKGKLDAIADDTAVYLNVKPTNASGEIELTEATQKALADNKLTAYVSGSTIVVMKDASQFDSSVQYMKKGNITIENFQVTVGGTLAKAAKVNIPVVLGKMTASGTAIDFRGKSASDVPEGSSAVEIVYIYTVYNAAGKVEAKKYYTFAGDAVTLSNAKPDKVSPKIDGGLVVVKNLADGKDVNATVKATVAGTDIKDVTAKIKVLGKTK